MKKFLSLLCLSLASLTGFEIEYEVDGQLLVYELSGKGLSKKSDASVRSYSVPATDKDIRDITYIVKTLANESLVKVASHKSSLKKAGDRVDHVHPFNFLLVIFTSEELKVCMRNLQGRSWVWSEFLTGITDSLKEEAAANNLSPYLLDFATKVKVDPSILYPALQFQKWNDFVDLLIEHVPREGDTNRYDM